MENNTVCLMLLEYDYNGEEDWEETLGFTPNYYQTCGCREEREFTIQSFKNITKMHIGELEASIKEFIAKEVVSASPGKVTFLPSCLQDMPGTDVLEMIYNPSPLVPDRLHIHCIIEGEDALDIGEWIAKYWRRHGKSKLIEAPYECYGEWYNNVADNQALYRVEVKIEEKNIAKGCQ